MKNSEQQIRKLASVLSEFFDFDQITALDEAKTIINYLETKPYRWVMCSDKLPLPVIYPTPNAPYYRVKTENFGEQLCMYMTDETGQNGWYTSYINKLIVPVLEWQE